MGNCPDLMLPRPAFIPTDINLYQEPASRARYVIRAVTASVSNTLFPRLIGVEQAVKHSVSRPDSLLQVPTLPGHLPFFTSSSFQSRSVFKIPRVHSFRAKVKRTRIH